MKKISFNNTQIVIGELGFKLLSDFLKKENIDNIFIFLDSQVRKFCLPILLDYVSELSSSHIVEIDSGETVKTLETVQQISLSLMKKKISRNSLIINLGGGVICDLGGFIAGVIKRGVRFINIPTNLMSQIDASVGGKVAVNIHHHKNQLGLFINPEIVLIYHFFNNSLSEKDFISAQAEILKYGLIADDLLWKLVSKKYDFKSNLEVLIYRCLKIKISIVKSDFFDFEDRRKLNFGHSISHAIESVFFTRKIYISHGHALSVGIICESFLSYKTFQFGKILLDEIVRGVLSVFPYILLDNVEDSLILHYLRSDKKNINNDFNFTLIKELGVSVVNCKVKEKDIINSLNYYRGLCQI